MSKIVEGAKLFLGSIDKKIDYSLMERHADMYLLGMLVVIDKAAADGVIAYQDCINLKASVNQEVINFKREVKDER